MTNDTEVWLLFAPFWLLGIAALTGSLWHFAHFAIVHARTQAAGHVGPHNAATFCNLPRCAC